MSSAFPLPVLAVDPGELTSLTPVLTTAVGTVTADGEWSTAALTAAVRRGDEAGVRMLYDRYHSRLMRYALVVSRGDEAAAVEAVQNAFLKAVRSLRPLADDEALWAWLARACRTSAADAGRRARRYTAALARLTAFFSSPSEPPPEDTEALWHHALEVALTELDAGSRALLEARYEQRLPLADIAAECGSSERGIEGRLARLREKLRQSILRQLAAPRHEL